MVGARIEIIFSLKERKMNPKLLKKGEKGKMNQKARTLGTPSGSRPAFVC